MLPAQSPSQPPDKGPLSASSKGLRFVHCHYDNKGARHEVHKTSFGVPITTDVPPPNPVLSRLAVR